MKRTRAGAAWRLLFLLFVSPGCLPPQEPASWVNGLRILAVKAQPPEVSLGERSHLTALVVDTAGRSLSVDWSECLHGPPQGQLIDRDCVLPDSAEARRPLGGGLAIDVTLPQSVDPQRLGLPDRSGGVYLPYVVQIAAGDSSLAAIYRLRIGTSLSTPVNRNPVLLGVFAVEGPTNGGSGEMASTLDEETPRVVRAGDTLTLRADFADGSAEKYVRKEARGNEPPVLHQVVETLSVSWFSTAGTISAASSGSERPDVILKLDEHLPQSGKPIDLWVVGRDERGGVDYLHRTLLFQ
jgi:hypothetical protein